MSLDPCLTLNGLHLREASPWSAAPSVLPWRRQALFQHHSKGCQFASSSSGASPSSRWGSCAFWHGHETLSSLYASWGRMMKPQRQAASLSRLSDMCSCRVPAAACLPPIRCSVPFSLQERDSKGFRNTCSRFPKIWPFSIFRRRWFKLSSGCVWSFTVESSSKKHLDTQWSLSPVSQIWPWPQNPETIYTSTILNLLFPKIHLVVPASEPCLLLGISSFNFANWKCLIQTTKSSSSIPSFVMTFLISTYPQNLPPLSFIPSSLLFYL